MYHSRSISSISSSSVAIFFLFALIAMCFSVGSATPHYDTYAMRNDEVDDESEMGPSTEPSMTPEPEEVCVDHTYVAARFPAHMLVHASQPLMADVLCVASSDLASLPCMTRHHLLRVAGQDVSAGEYCARDEVMCTQRKMLVNSVLSHAWTDETHGQNNHVTLTMLDARHPANLQFALHRAIAFKRAAHTAVRTMFASTSV